MLGTAAAAGSTDEAIRRDSTIVAFDATVPVTQAFGDSAATGSAAVAARRDHKHAMPANPLIETSGPTTLAFGAVANGDYLTRSGSSIIGGSPTPGGPPTGAAGGDLGGTYPNPKLAWDGWIDDSAHTWTYASASTFTIAGVDLTSVFTPGTRLKFTQTTVKYGIVASSSFSTNTTVTIIVNTDYVLANAAISANYYSYVANPRGYPGWFNYTSGCAGFSSLSTNDARFAVNGRVCQLAVHFIGASNATTFTFNLPVACVVAEQFNYWLVLSNDNSVTAVRRLAFATTTSGRFDSALNANNGWNSGGGTKSAVIDLAYEF